MNETRRRLLAFLGTTSVAAFAGCAGTDDEGTDPATGTDDPPQSTTIEPNKITSASATTDFEDSVSPSTATGQIDTPLPFQQVAKLIANDGGRNDTFGTVAVSENGSTIVIGAFQDDGPDDSRPNSGSAYVFEESDGEWSQQAKLFPELTGGEAFGSSVAVSGDGSTALIGARNDGDPNGDSAGSAYIFEASGGEWSQQAKLAADDGDSGDGFGASVTLSSDGSIAVIGTLGDDPGSAYVFVESDESWSQQTKLVADDGNDRGDFGSPVAVSADGTTAVIGADDPLRERDDAGATYVFKRSDKGWSQQAKLTAEDGDSDDNLGGSVAVSGDGSTVIVGSLLDDEPNGTRAGSAYVFGASGGEWKQQAKLAADDGDDEDRFGVSVAVSSDAAIAIIGAQRDEDPSGEMAGSAYVFERSGGEWDQRAKLTADDGDSEDRFGVVSVSDDGSTAIVGALTDDNPNGENAGSAYVFK